MFYNRVIRGAQGAFAVLVVGVLALATAPGDASAIDRRLPRGNNTEVPYLVGDVIHAGDQEIPIPDDLVRPEGTLTFLGRSHLGFVVVQTSPVSQADATERDEVYLVTRTGAELIITVTDLGGLSAPRLSLSDNRRRILVSDEQRPDANHDVTGLTVYNLNGHATTSGIASGGFHLLDFDGSRVLYRTWFTTRMWRAGVTGTDVRKFLGVFGSLRWGHVMLRHDVRAMYRQRTVPRFSWTHVAPPHRVDWRAPFTPVAINHTGKRLVGSPNGAAARVQIRRAADGSLVHTFRLADFPGVIRLTPISWSDTGHIVIRANRTNDEFLLRCSVNGRCVVASPHFTQAISIPTFPSAPSDRTCRCPRSVRAVSCRRAVVRSGFPTLGLWTSRVPSASHRRSWTGGTGGSHRIGSRIRMPPPTTRMTRW